MKQLTAFFVGLALLVPAIAGAQSISTIELQELLAQDRNQLIALNGEDAVRAYLEDLLFLILVQSGITQTPVVTHTDDVRVETLSVRDIEDNSVELRGEVREGYDVKVWFALSRTDKTPSCTSSSQKESVSSRFDDGDDFDEEVSGLRDDTRYYYRACAQEKDGGVDSGDIRRFTTDDDNGSSNNDDPEVEVDNARNIQDDSAELRGSVDMNDFRNGIVFFLWGEDEGEVSDATNEDEYDDIRERGDDLQKQRVDSDLDGEEDYEREVRNLDDDTRHYYTLCVEYEDEDDDETLECGSIEDFRTDN